MLGVVFLAGGHAGNALPAALLGAVGVGGHALDVTEVRQRHRHLFLLDEISQHNLIVHRHNLCAARVVVFVLDN